MKNPTTPADTLDQVTDPASPAGTPIRTMEKTRARVDALRPHPRNPRKISPARLEQLQRTLEAEPEMLEARPLIALPDGTVVAGNQRLAAARALGWETVPVVFADLSEAEVTRWMLLDNRGFGEDDREAVTALLGELEAAGSDLTLTGYDVGELDAMLRELHRPAADPDAAPEVPPDPASLRGTVYELGPHRLLCGDATDEADMGQLMAGQHASCVFTDPPYGVEYTGGLKPRASLAGDERGTAIYETSLPLMVAYAAKKAAFYVWYADLSIAAAAAAAAGLTVRCQIIWAKNNAQFMSAAHYHGKHEPCIYAARRSESPCWYGPKNEVTLWEYPRASSNDLHPTQKPVAIAERALRNSTRRGEIVLDSFGGSGSTLIACEQIGRRCFAMELDPGYCDVIRQRYADYVDRPELAP